MQNNEKINSSKYGKTPSSSPPNKEYVTNLSSYLV
jgi:hypothetical protein